MSEDFKPIDFSKYAELGDLWDKHPSNTQGAYARGDYKPAEGEAGQVLKRYTELTSQLSDEVGNNNYVEALLGLGAVGGIGNGLTGENLGDPNYYKNMMGKRKEFLDQGRSVQDADANEAYRFAALLAGERQPDLDYVQADRARRYAAQYGTPEQVGYTNQLATQLRSAQPQGLPSLTGLLNTSPLQTSKFVDNPVVNPIQSYLQTLETPYYLNLVRKLSRKQ